MSLYFFFQIDRLVIYCEFIKMSRRKQDFKLTNEEICEILFGDNSEHEEDLRLDKEDIGFLEEDIGFLEEDIGFLEVDILDAEEI